jgi:hypothetical protein
MKTTKITRVMAIGLSALAIGTGIAQAGEGQAAT